MKKLTLLLGCALFSFGVNAQDEAQTQQKDFNKWSIELNAGVHKPARPMAGGYYTSTPSFFQGDLGVRYMLNERFGLKLDAGYNNFENADDSREFQTQYFRTSLQGVINAGNILNFRSWTNSLNVLVHAGGGYASLTPQEPVELDGDNMLHLIGGITPQLRLSDHLALTGDLSAIANIRQDYSFDGTGRTSTRGVNGMIVNASIGITVYLGKAEKHADWYSKKEDGTTAMDEMEKRVGEIESGMKDTDRDGVPDYLDREPNTTNGVAVDTKGVAVDKNGNGVPDELEDSLDELYAKSGEVAENESAGGGGGLIKDLINKGYVNVYFKFNSTQPETYSLQSINYLVKYMNENESAEAELVGYADEIGDPAYNETLSENRAKKVYDILIASGVDENRLSYTGGGEDNSVDKGSSDARQIVRRVTFKLK